MAREDRFARQRLIPGWRQERLAGATVAVAGVGALGNEVAKNLALAGVGRLLLCDPDVVSVSNLSRTVLFRPGDVGTAKATAAAAALRQMAPGLVAVPRFAELVSGIGLGELTGADLVVGCLDSVRARVQLLGRCALVGATLLDGGTHPWGGEVRVRLSPDEPCFGCTLTPHQRGATDVPWRCADPVGGGPQAADIATTSLVAAWLAGAAVRLLFGEPPPYRVLAIDTPGGRATPVTITADPDCPFHRPLDGPLLRSPVDDRATVAEFLATLDEDAEPQTWKSFPLRPRCVRCDDYAESWGSDNGGDFHASCSRCGAPARPRSSLRLRDADPGSRLCDLGIAPEEILPVARPGGEFACHLLKCREEAAGVTALAASPTSG